jgi:predicted nuclease of restriction endonuclease-like (RecB) superfamily
VSGFSVENLKHIRYWYNFYTNNEKWLQGVTQIESMVKSIPWGHNQRIMYKCKDIDEALFYIQKTMDNNWSRNVLVHQIESDLYARQGKAINNFQVKLPEPQSDLAEQTLKDPYNFDFLALREEYNERELEDALVEQITQLFYHVKLHCYVVVELKTEKFKPEFAGQLNFYVTAVNKNMKDDQDNQTIGILICKDKDDVVAEYSLENISQPIGIAQYELTKVLRKEFKSSLPTIEEIEEGLSE